MAAARPLRSVSDPLKALLAKHGQSRRPENPPGSSQDNDVSGSLKFPAIITVAP